MIEIPYGNCSVAEYVTKQGETKFVDVCICQFSELGTYTYSSWEDAKHDLKDYYELDGETITKLYTARKVVEL